MRDWCILLREHPNDPRAWLIAVLVGPEWSPLVYSSTVNLPSDTNDFLSTAALTFSPDGSLLMSCHTPGSDYSSITLWETKTWKVARAITTEKSSGGCTAAGFTSDGKHIVRLTQKNSEHNLETPLKSIVPTAGN